MFFVWGMRAVSSSRNLQILRNTLDTDALFHGGKLEVCSHIVKSRGGKNWHFHMATQVFIVRTNNFHRRLIYKENIKSNGMFKQGRLMDDSAPTLCSSWS